MKESYIVWQNITYKLIWKQKVKLTFKLWFSCPCDRTPCVRKTKPTSNFIFLRRTIYSLWIKEINIQQDDTENFAERKRAVRNTVIIIWAIQSSRTCSDRRVALFVARSTRVFSARPGVAFLACRVQSRIRPNVADPKRQKSQIGTQYEQVWPLCLSFVFVSSD